MKKETTIKGTKGEIVLYRTQGGRTELGVRLEADTLWLTQKQMAELFATERSVITKHVRNIFRSGELAQESNVQKMHSFRKFSYPSLLAQRGVSPETAPVQCRLAANSAGGSANSPRLRRDSNMLIL